MYRCLSCKKENEIEDKVRCAYCGFRILVKERPEIPRRVKVE